MNAAGTMTRTTTYGLNVAHQAYAISFILPLS
jgi:hypothetical protein